jgi:hypothetical protein
MAGERRIPVRSRFMPRQREGLSFVAKTSSSDPKADSQEIKGKDSSSGTTASNICAKSTNEEVGALGFESLARLVDRSRYSVAGQGMLIIIGTLHIVLNVWIFLCKKERTRHERRRRKVMRF